MSSVVAHIGFTDSAVALEKHVLLQLPHKQLWCDRLMKQSNENA